jgi:ribosomal protein S18 acetylase RimI-like enzyme
MTASPTPPASNATIRDFRESDLFSVRRLIHETIDQSYTGVYPPRAVQFFKQFHSEENIAERSETGTVLVVEQAGAIVATGTVVGNEIFGVFVNPACQRCGYGRALMRELETRAKTNGCTVVELSASLPSRLFYESLGYEILEEGSIDVGEGQHLDFWKARKSLAMQ